ncbi:hemerythrin domain-containing protein [Janthinobacterium sp. 17J80-10]|uniref:hemerythrin domain-containing protein n=1 Tax=Janthinobacterium sp. 17J80-10 TaxID=2497863 RepID=UPI0010053DC5|nr:hemerythrin domain-containing protein [Janthinobacterium sp. 17J80-10]QAU33129.1 hemerythrin domain-containing protein [Janthinobacterium sp. 17J80-10]
MKIDKFKVQHEKIYGCIDSLRNYAVTGIAENAPAIARLVISMSSVIKLHLAVEDTVLYPALKMSANARLAKKGGEYQAEMKAIAEKYQGFARRWNTSDAVTCDPEGFRADANRVLKMLHERIRREDREFYPEIEAF